MKLEPVRFAWDTVTLEPPELVSEAVFVLLLPTCTVPKLTEVALKLADETPVPDSGMEKALEEPLFVMARLTLLLPADWGAKATLNDALCPAFNVTGKLSPVTLNPAPAAIWVRVMAIPPELVRVSGRD